MPDTPSPDTQSSAIIAIRDSEHPTISMPPAQLAAAERALVTARTHLPSGAVDDDAALERLQVAVAEQLDAFEKRMDERLADFKEETTEGRLSRTELSAIAAAAAAGVGAAHKGNGKDSSPPSSIRSRVKRWHAIAVATVSVLTTILGADAAMGDSRLVRALVAAVSAAAAVMTD
jgi:hypothetical protein